MPVLAGIADFRERLHFKEQFLDRVFLHEPGVAHLFAQSAQVDKGNELQKYRNRYAGFYTLLTNDIKDPVEASQVYRNKDNVEELLLC